jgi:acetyl esterase/lipase
VVKHHQTRHVQYTITRCPTTTMATNTFLNIDPAAFNPASISPEAHAFNAKLIAIMKTGPKWWEVGAAKYRQMRAAGETPLPAATYLDTAANISIPSRDTGRSIPCRTLKPTDEKEPQAVFMHIHGGGWVLQDEKSQDPVLQDLANESGVVCVSIGYRLAPEDPFPAGPNDCYDAAEWLVDHAVEKFGVGLGFVGGESAGGHLSMLVALHLLQHEQAKYRDFRFKGLLLHFGCFSMAWTPQVYNFIKGEDILVLDREIMDHYVKAFLPELTDEQKRDPKVSPLYADLEKLRGRLPPALLTCGTEDCLLDDTIFMASKWRMAGGEAVVKIVPGACHGYIMFPRGMKGSGSEEGLNAVAEFLRARIG